MIKFSGVIITFNEESKIEKCLKSLVPVVDEIVVVDSFSTDNTKSICKRYNVKFIERKFTDYVTQKNFALEQATYDHIVSLDADEALSAKLQDNIKQLKTNWEFDGYVTRRLNYFRDQWIKYTTWSPDHKIRIFDRRKAYWKGHLIHEKIGFHVPNTKTKKLDGEILHYTYQTLEELKHKGYLFSEMSAKSKFELGEKAPFYKLIFNPLWAFIQSYFIKLGFLDGVNGFIISLQAANVRLMKYKKLRKLIKEKN